MRFIFKIIHWIVFLWIILLVFRVELIYSYLTLFIDYIALLVSDTNVAIQNLNFRIIDALMSSVIMILFGLVTLVFRKKIKFLFTKLNFTTAFFVTLCFVLVFAPIIADENPEFSANLSVTKLLPPLSSVIQIEIKTDQSRVKEEKFSSKIERIVKPSFNDNIILADSIHITDKVVYFQKNKYYEIEKEKLVESNGKIIRSKKTFLLGTDEFGRDLFSRLVYGTRISISVGLGAVILSFIIGLILGFVAGYRGGFLDSILSRIAEMFLAFPIIYLIILILAVFGSSVISVIIVLGISGWMSLFKIVKSEVLSIKHKDYFSTAELVGLSKLHLLAKEIFPVLLVPILVNLVFLFSNVVLAEAALSYLGLGTGYEYPSWGAMISSGQEYITKAWWLISFPGLGLMLTLFFFNSSGRKLGNLFNPRIK